MKLPWTVGWISLAAALAAGAAPAEAGQAEAVTDRAKREGVALRLLADHARIAPGATLTAGLSLRHDPGYHTYWRSPGIVGLPTAIEWDLPAGVSAGPILWPGPELSKMGQITVWGYERDVVLLTEIKIAPEFAGKTIPLRAKVSWMACARRCHPGWIELQLEVPVGAAKLVPGAGALISAARKELPVGLPTGWSFEPERNREEEGDRVSAVLKGPRGFETRDIVFFCDDNQVNSELPQQIKSGPQGLLVMRFPVSEYAPEKATGLSGVLYHPGGWPGLDSRWLRVEAEYPDADVGGYKGSRHSCRRGCLLRPGSRQARPLGAAGVGIFLQE